ncbi:unnamed protein product, partial [Heterotrigona itama]
MSNRLRFQLRSVLILWNTLLALFFIFGFIRMRSEISYVLRHYGSYYSICLSKDNVLFQTERHDELFHSHLDVLYFKSNTIQSTEVDNHDHHYAMDRANNLGFLIIVTHNYARSGEVECSVTPKS